MHAARELATQVEPETSARLRAGACAAREALEEPRAVRVADPGPVITNAHDYAVAGAVDLDHDRRARQAVAASVPDRPRSRAAPAAAATSHTAGATVSAFPEPEISPRSSAMRNRRRICCCASMSAETRLSRRSSREA